MSQVVNELNRDFGFRNVVNRINTELGEQIASIPGRDLYLKTMLNYRKILNEWAEFGLQYGDMDACKEQHVEYIGKLSSALALVILGYKALASKDMPDIEMVSFDVYEETITALIDTVVNNENTKQNVDVFLKTHNIALSENLVNPDLLCDLFTYNLINQQTIAYIVSTFFVTVEILGTKYNVPDEGSEDGIKYLIEQANEKSLELELTF